MSEFADRFAVRSDRIYSRWGDPALYMDDVNVLIDSDITVIIDHSLKNYIASGIDVAGAVAVLKVRRSEVDERPFRHYQFCVDSKTYHVEDVFSSDDFEHQMTVIL